MHSEPIAPHQQVAAMSNPDASAHASKIVGQAPAGAGLDPRGLPAGYPFNAEWELTPRQTAAAMAVTNLPAASPSSAARPSAQPLLLDCRRPEEWEFCRIAGATLFPMQSIVQQADEIEDAAGGKDHPVIVYCHHGRRSLQVTATLRGLGFTDVKSIAGGIDLWSLDIDPTVKRY